MKSKFFITGLFCSIAVSFLFMVSCARGTNGNQARVTEEDGGLIITMELPVAEVIDVLTDYCLHPQYKEAIAAAQEELKNGSSNDFLSLFFEAYEADGSQLAPLFCSTMRDRIDLDMSDSIVEIIVRDVVEETIDNSINVLRARIEGFSGVQPDIERLGNNRIKIVLLGIHDQQHVTRLLQSDGGLEFWETYNYNEICDALTQIEEKLAEENESLFQLFVSQGVVGFPVVGTAAYGDTAKVNLLLEKHKRLLPMDTRFCWEIKSIEERGEHFRLIALKSQRGGRPSLEGDFITDARADYEQNGRAEVLIKMNSAGARKWAHITQENIGRCIAVVLDGKVYTYPLVQDEITGGSCVIARNFTMEEAKDLANILKSGKMPIAARVIGIEEIASKK